MGEASVNLRKKELRKAVRRGLCSMTEEDKQRESEDIWRRVESLDEFRLARVVALYWSLPDEPFTHEVVEKWSGHRTVLLPCIEGDEIILRRYEGRERMCTGGFCIGEPVGEVWERLQDIDLIIVPGVAFSREGCRLGRGRGFYDRLFARFGAGRGGRIEEEYRTDQGRDPVMMAGVGDVPDAVPCGFPCQDTVAVKSEVHPTDCGTGASREKSLDALPVTVGVCFSCQVVPEVPLEAHDIVLDMVISG